MYKLVLLVTAEEGPWTETSCIVEILLHYHIKCINEPLLQSHVVSIQELKSPFSICSVSSCVEIRSTTFLNYTFVYRVASIELCKSKGMGTPI